MRKKVELFEKDKDGNITINVAATEASDNWLRAARLLREGNPESLAEYERMEMLRRIHTRTYNEKQQLRIFTCW